MGIGRVILCIIFPPLAVLDRGPGNIILTVILTILGWVPGVICALILNSQAANQQQMKKMFNQQNRRNK